MPVEFPNVPDKVEWKYFGPDWSLPVAQGHLSSMWKEVKFSRARKKSSIEVYTETLGVYYVIPSGGRILEPAFNSDSKRMEYHEWIAEGGTRVTTSWGGRLPVIITFYNSRKDVPKNILRRMLASKT